MREFIIFIFIVIALLIAVILILLYKLSGKVNYSHQHNTDEIHQYIHDCVEHAFRQESEKLAAKYAKYLEAAANIEAQLSDEEADLVPIAKGAYLRAIILVTQDNENVVTAASGDALKLASKISSIRNRLSHDISAGNDASTARDVKALSQLQEQEAQAKRRLDEALSRLNRFNALLIQTGEPSDGQT